MNVWGTKPPPKLQPPPLEAVQKTVGIEPLPDLYDLRHTYATFALRAGVSRRPGFQASRQRLAAGVDAR